ncbi:MAG: L-lactate dehydrogenase [Mycoplasmatales bacterium]
MNKRKVVIVGAGMVGASYGYSLANQDLVNELVFIDVNNDAAQAQADDIIHGTAFLPNQPKIYAGEYSDCADADIICITAGAAQKPGQTRLDLVKINTNIMKSIIGEIKKTAFDGFLLIASNPVDIMAYVAQKESGYPVHKVLGSGTTLDTARLRVNLATYLDCNPTNVHAYIIGEHGDSSLPVWSTATIGQKPLLDIIEQSNGKFTMEGINKCFEEARDAAYGIIKGKGATYFGIGVSLARITKAIFGNQNVILTCSTLLNGEYGVDDIYIPVPVVVGGQGVKEIQSLEISTTEQKDFEASVNALKNIIKSLD